MTNLELLNQLKDDCEEKFYALEIGLRKQETLVRDLPELFIHISMNENGSKARINYIPSNRVSVTISAYFLEGIHQSIVKHEDIISSFMMVGMNGPVDEESFDVSPSLEAIYDLAVQFVIHHELFHLLCGHLDLKRGNREMAEINELYQPTRGESKEKKEERLKFYYAEVEADGSSIFWMIDRVVHGSVNQALFSYGLLEADCDASISELEGKAKLFAFKMVFISFWLVTSIIEVSRANKNLSKKHPLPATRILSGIHTLLEFYSNLIVTEENSEENIAKLDDENIAKMDDFFSGIIGPFCMFFRDFPDATTSDFILDNKDEFDFHNRVISILRDSKNLLLNKPAESPEEFEISDLKPLRKIMTQALESYRYMEDMN